mmetsp:Transcript_23149/g.32318  ORF Transcript_23149/g.32318 Transcript_23149/m.32318 type:complete len:240 (-) Transcript_23149:41-760(-)
MRCQHISRFYSRGEQIKISSRLLVSTRRSSSRYRVSNQPSPIGGILNFPHLAKSSAAVVNLKFVRFPPFSGIDNDPETPRPPPFRNGIIFSNSSPSIVCDTSPLIPHVMKALISFSVVHSSSHFFCNKLLSAVAVIGDNGANSAMISSIFSRLVPASALSHSINRASFKRCLFSSSVDNEALAGEKKPNTPPNDCLAKSAANIGVGGENPSVVPPNKKKTDITVSKKRPMSLFLQPLFG